MLTGVARKLGVSPTQVLVRWSMQHGYVGFRVSCLGARREREPLAAARVADAPSQVPLPKSVRAERTAQNIDVLGFEISAEDMVALDGLDERFFTEWEEWGNLDPTALP